MGLDRGAVGAVSSPTTRAWTSRDSVVYALGVGAGQDELAFVTDDTRDMEPQALPTMAVILAVPGPEIASAMGDYDRRMLVHGSQETIIHSTIPAAGAILYKTTITGIYDKGSGAAVATETVAVDADGGAQMFTNRSVAFIRGEGGWGGERGPSVVKLMIPDRAADHIVDYPLADNQAYLYRLSGDRNPLHSDPKFAKAAGFDRPILHGLCTYGYVGRALLQHACHGDVTLFREMSARFVAPMYPGELLTVAMWNVGEGRTVFEGRRNGSEIVIAGSLGSNHP